LLLTSCISTIELMRVCKVWNVFLAHRLGVLPEVGMVDGIDCIDPLAPIQTHEVFDK
jgi:hypothetical protein